MSCFFDFLPLNMLLVRSHQAEIIAVKRLRTQQRDATRVGVEPTRDRDRRKNGALTLPATLPALKKLTWFVRYLKNDTNETFQH